MTSEQLLMSHLDLLVYNDDSKPCFGILIPGKITGDRAKEMLTFANTLIDTANAELPILMDLLLEVSDRHISFPSKHDGRDMTYYKFALASHCMDPYLNKLLTKYQDKVAAFEYVAV